MYKVWSICTCIELTRLKLIGFQVGGYKCCVLWQRELMVVFEATLQGHTLTRLS